MSGLRRWLPGLVLLLGALPAQADCVVLLHGLGRGPASMLALQRALERDGYTVQNLGYPSTRRPIEGAAPQVGHAIEACRAQNATPIHFVTHSMGGILLRLYFRDHAVAEAGRVVMLAPPNGGSEIVDAYRDRWWFRAFTGPAGQQLGTDGNSLPKRLPVLPLEVGIIAGSRSSDPWFSGLFAGPHDGKVSTASAALPGMKAFLVVPVGHSWIMNSATVIRATQCFLRHGRFSAPALIGSP